MKEILAKLVAGNDLSVEEAKKSTGDNSYRTGNGCTDSSISDCTQDEG